MGLFKFTLKIFDPKVSFRVYTLVNLLIIAFKAVELTMRIGELSKQTGFQVETLRYYEKQGLLQPVSRTDSGYREYDAESLKQLKFIHQAKSVGFSLNEISELLTLRVEKDQHSCAEVKSIAEQKLEQIENKITELTRMRDALYVISDACCGGDEPATSCTILNALDDELKGVKLS
ncbi:MAG: MerR family Zn(II)-responsive transcriptional regulator of zntA [Cocleimonas sp.]